jgi:Putative beta-barrel porin-2, OmpL-like. bbp2
MPDVESRQNGLNAGSITEMHWPWKMLWFVFPMAAMFSLPVSGQEIRVAASDPSLTTAATQAGSETGSNPSPQDTTDQPASSPWQYGGFVDAAYLLDFNHPANDVFRSRGTTYKVDFPILNIVAAYLQKNSSESSRWGIRLTLQAGRNTQIFGFSATAPNLPGAEGLRHLGPTNVSYLAPVGTDLTIQGGIFSSLIGYDSLYAKDNFSYTRPWAADFTPYLMMGVDASYPFSDKLTVTGYAINGYWHRADANSVPSWGGQATYKATSHTTVKETFLIGPHQSNTSFEFWRYLWDSSAEWKTDCVTTAFEYHIGTEEVATAGNSRALWMAAQLPVHWVLNKHWSMTERPEVLGPKWSSDRFRPDGKGEHGYTGIS